MTLHTTIQMDEQPAVDWAHEQGIVPASWEQQVEAWENDIDLNPTEIKLEVDCDWEPYDSGSGWGGWFEVNTVWFRNSDGEPVKVEYTPLWLDRKLTEKAKEK